MPQETQTSKRGTRTKKSDHADCPGAQKVQARFIDRKFDNIVKIIDSDRIGFVCVDSVNMKLRFVRELGNDERIVESVISTSRGADTNHVLRMRVQKMNYILRI